MPFSITTNKHTADYWDIFFIDFVKPTVEKLGYSCTRSSPKPGNILKGVVKDLVCSDLVLAVLTDLNPNVWYELGIRHARQNGTIMIIERGKKLPYDINQYGVIEYDETTRTGTPTFKKDLGDFIQKIETASPIDNPVADFLTSQEFLLELLRNSDVKKFNESRPRGRLDLGGAHLKNTKLGKVNFRNTSLIQANLEGADLSESDLTDAHLDNAYLTKTDFSRAIFGGRATLNGATIYNAKFNDADLSGAHFFGAEVKGADFTGARFTNFHPERLKNDLRKNGALNVSD